jgi:Mg/Co/Ni transporter MgtE
MISIYPTNQVATVVFAREMPTGSINSAEVLQLINNLNVSFIIGSVATMVNEMNVEYLLAKSAVPTIGGVDVPAVLDALVVGLVGLILEVEPVVQRVINGELSVDEATRRLT